MNNVQYIYEMFSGSIDPQIIQDVMSALNGDTNKAIEHLLEIAPSQNTSEPPYVQQNQGYFAHTQPVPRHVVPAIILSDFIPQYYPSAYPVTRPQHLPSWPRTNQNASNLSNGYYQHGLANTNQPSSDQSTSSVKIESNDKTNLMKNVVSNHSTIMSQKDAIGIVKQYLMKKEKVLVILRGCPGSGKTTMARQIKFNGVILSTDDYFSSNGIYNHSLAALSKAHEWNREQAQQAMKINKNPVIIDNTNTQKWEMIPYAALAHKFDYAIEIIEPDVQWRLKPGILAKKNIHGVKKEKIVSMMNRYDNNVTGCDLLKMVKGETCSTGGATVVNQEISDAKINDNTNSVPPPRPPDNWKNMKYGDRTADYSPETTADSCSKDSSPERKDEGAWEGECATLGEWMSWGEEGKCSPNENGFESPNSCSGSTPCVMEDSSTGQIDDIGNAVLDVIKLDDNFDNDACSGFSSRTSSLQGEQSEKSFEDDALSSRASSVDKQDGKVFELVERLSDELDVVLISKKIDKAIGTEDEELNIVDMFEKRGYPDTSEKFQAIVAPRKKFIAFESSLPSTPSRRLFRYGLDKSAQTSDDFIDDWQMVVLLECCFPDIDPDDIKKLYSEKKNDPKALVDILTDAGKQENVDSPDKEESDGEMQSPIFKNEDQTVLEEMIADQVTQESNSSFNGLPPLLISTELGDQLLKLFGRPPNFNAANDGKGYTIEMSVELAHMIHQTWTRKCTEDKLERSSNNVHSENSDCKFHEVNSDHIVVPPTVSHNSLSTKIKLKQLYEKFPNINKKILDNIFGASGYMLDVAVKTIQNSPDLIAPVQISMTDEYATELEKLNFNKAIEASLEIFNNRTSDSEEEDSLNLDHSKMVEKMNYSQHMFKEYVGKAKDAFGNKKFPQAHHYSIKAREWKQKYYEEKQMSAELLLKKTTESSMLTGTIDLHGLKVKEAIDLISEVLTSYGQELSKKRSHLFVITGRGNHSAGGVARIKPCLESYLRRNKFLFTEATPGILKVNIGRR